MKKVLVYVIQKWNFNILLKALKWTQVFEIGTVIYRLGIFVCNQKDVENSCIKFF